MWISWIKDETGAFPSSCGVKTQMWWAVVDRQEEAEILRSCAEIRLHCYYSVALFVCDLMKTRSRQLAVMLVHSRVPLFKSESADLATNQSSKANMHTVIYGASAQFCWIQAHLGTDPDGRSVGREVREAPQNNRK